MPRQEFGHEEVGIRSHDLWDNTRLHCFVLLAVCILKGDKMEDKLYIQENIPWLGRGYQVKYTSYGGDKIEFGFVTSGPTPDNCYFVRYWHPDLKTLRTLANSERTPGNCLVQFESVPKSQVERALKQYC